MNLDPEIQQSVHYLASSEALQSLERDPYWPKWNSPWWHMLLLHEMGETKRIPETTVSNYITALDRIPLKIFPIVADEIPQGVDPYRGIPCHCQLGNVYQVLSAWGVDVDKKLPWIRPWLLGYQMADGGMNCDNEAYSVKDECPSSMVGTIAAFEAVLLHTPRPWTSEERTFLDRGAHFLIERKLMLGSQSKHNADERMSAVNWQKLCFPRFYFYDVLRGLNALLRWSELRSQSLPAGAIHEVVTLLSQRFPDGVIRNERRSYEGVRTLAQTPSGAWTRGQPASLFPLLTKMSRLGEVSPYLSKQWAECTAYFHSDRRLVIWETSSQVPNITHP